MRKSHHPRRSATRAAARPSALLLRLVARISGWLKAWLARWNPLRRARKAVADYSHNLGRIHFETLEPRLLMSADLMPLAQTTLAPHATVAVERSSVADTSVANVARMHALAVAPGATGSATVTDADGTVITVTIVGNGALELLAQGSGYALNISGTNAASVVTLTASGGDGKALLTGISADTALGQADLAAADLTGNASFAAVATLKLGNISNASITNGSVGEASLSAKSVADLRLSAPLAKLSVSADNWTTSAPGASPSASFLNAAGLRSLAVAGEFAADVRLSGTGITSGFVLDNASIGGALSSGQWFVIGRANSVQAGSTGGAWRAHFSGNLGQLRTAGDMSGFIAAGGLQLLSVGGSLRGATILPGANLGTDAQLGGTGDAADRFSAGTLARLRVVGDIVDTRIAISLDPVNGVLFDGNDVSVGTAANRMQELIVGGQLRGSTLIVAPALPALVNVGGAVVDPATLPQLSTSPRDAVLPQLSAQLRSDTGSSASDGITNDASLLARVVDVGGVAALRGRIGSGAFQTLATTIQPDGSFLVTAASLAALNGGSLPDGAYSIELQAADFAGNTSNTATVAFTLDRTAPSATVALAAASDTGTIGDNITTASSVTIEGTAAAGTLIALANPAQSTTAAADGTFSFSGLALALGDNDFAFTLTDAAGNTGTATLRIRRDPPVVADTTPPTVTAALAADTGSSASDGITRNPEIAGQASDNVGVVQLLATLDPGSSGTPTFTDLTGLLAAGGSFTLNRATLDNLAGGTLSDGAHTVRLIARDAAGNESTPRDVSFTLDTAAPSATLVLAAGSDTGTPGDNITTASTVTIGGSTEAGALVSLASPAQSTTAAADGSYSFTGLALALGANDFSVTVTDAAGNTGSATLRVTRETAGGADTTAPTVTAALQADTGRSASDGITNNPAISGLASDNVAATQLLAAIDPGNGSTQVFTDLSSLLAANGSFTISKAVLDAMAGGTLADGVHTVRVLARDAAGNQSTPRDVVFTLDTGAPAFTGFGLATADASNDTLDATNSATVQLKGTAEAGARVTLGGLSTVAGAGGAFVLPGVALNLGANALTLTATDTAGNSSTFTRTITRTTATQSDAVLVWNDIALRAVQLDVTDPPVATRTLAIVSLAQYDALAAIEGTPAYLVRRSASGPASAQVAAAVAAHRILSLTYPAQKAVFDAALVTSLAAIADGAGKDNGIALGLSVADAIIALRADDGSEDFVAYDGGTAIGQWRPTGPMFDVADEPQWKNVKPFALTSPDQFRPAAPPALDSAAYATAVEEIKRLGSATSTDRTANQTQIALFWADGKGSYTPPGHWNQVAEEVARARGNSLSANARLFAQLNVALADSAIACWDAKYTYGLWRPETAVQNADLDNNPGTTVDAAWRSLLITPPHPEYVSGHSTFSAAAASVLAANFGDNTAFSTTSVTLLDATRQPVARNFTSFSQAAQEAGRSRIYGGIHFEFTNQAGQVLGKQVAGAVLAKFALTQDTQAPGIVIAETPAATKTNFTLTGQLLDNLSGVASAQYRIDSGALQALTLDVNGGFSITTSLATDGSADGTHTVTVLATDAAGNANTGVTRSFTLDTKAPTLTLASLADGDTLAAASRLTGTASPTGTTLTQLSYRFDSGATRSLVFDSTTGAFDEALPFGNLDVGDHTLLLTARDAAGNVTTLSRSVKVDALAALTITSLTPTDGSGDVGVTVRPQIRFSRAVNTATLNAESFYATAPDGSKIAATIVPANDGTYAWLFFTNPMPGGSQVALHVEGSKIRGAADGAFLDADGNGAAGGTLTQSFTTVSRTAVAGTKLTGKVVDPGPDLEPMTFDDIRRGPDGIIHTSDDVFLNPIAHAKVYILGQEDKFVYTDAGGNFTLTNVPAGTVKVAIDGRTATNAPSGVFFPEMVMDAELRPGVANTLMGSMGSTEERLANSDRKEVYLPRVPTSSLQNVSDTATTVVTVTDAASAPQLSAEERAAMTLTVNPGSAIGENGQVLSNVQIGISTVPPELVRDMLPPGVLQHTFDITIQAPGVATFAEPVQITFPNVFGAAPGTKLNILSFDHTTGMLVINGTGTVSPDGKSVVSDPDSGVRAPGWHGMVPPGVCIGSGGPPTALLAAEATPSSETNDYRPLVVGEPGATALLTLNAWNVPSPTPGTTPGVPTTPNCDIPQRDPKAQPQPYKIVNISLESNAADFLKVSANSLLPIGGGSFAIVAGDTSDYRFELQALPMSEVIGPWGKGVDTFQGSVLYSTKVRVSETTVGIDGTRTTTVKNYFITRFVDVSDASADATVTLASTLNDGQGIGVKREHDIVVSSGAASAPTLAKTEDSNGLKVALTPTKATITLDPSVDGPLNGSISITPKGAAAALATPIALTGAGTKQIEIVIDRASFEAALATVGAKSTLNPLDGFTNAEIGLVDDAAKRTAIVDAVRTRIETLYAHFSAAIKVSISPDLGGLSPAPSPDRLTPPTATPADNQVFVFATELATANVLGVAYIDLDTSKVKTLYANASKVSTESEAYILSTSLNGTPSGFALHDPMEVLDGGFDLANQFYDFTDQVSLVNALAMNIAHEVGHTFGLPHTEQGSDAIPPINGVPGSADIMGQGVDPTGAKTFSLITTGSLDLALKLGWTQPLIAPSLWFLATAIQKGMAGGSNVSFDGSNSNLLPLDPSTAASFAGVSVLVDPTTQSLVSGVASIGSSLVSATLSEPVTREFEVWNLGQDPMTISQVERKVGSPDFALTGLSPGQALPPGGSIRFGITLRASDVAPRSAEFSILTSGSADALTLRVGGTGVSAGGYAHLSMQDNNAGGVVLGRTDSASTGYVLTNTGSQAITLRDVRQVQGDGSFRLQGASAGLLVGVPVSLGAGESMAIDYVFAPDSAGLQRATFEIRTDSTDTPAIRFGLTGTGLSTNSSVDWGDDYYSIKEVGAAASSTQALLGRSDYGGRFGVTVGSNTRQSIGVFDPASALIATRVFTTANSGQGQDITAGLLFGASTARDQDQDGIPDDIESVIGTRIDSVDTDKDGLDDFTEIKQGLDPLGGLNIPVGVVAATALQGTAEAVTTLGTIDGTGAAIALVASGAHGLAIVDASSFTKPRALAELDLDGVNIDVAADAVRGIAVIAAGEAGLHILDISDRSAPTLLQTVTLGGAVSGVVARDGIAYAIYGNRVAAIDLNTGDVRQTLDLAGTAGATLTDIAIDGSTLYTMDSGGTLRTVSINDALLVPRDSLAVNSAGGRIFVGGGVAYVGTTTEFSQGFSTVNVSDPANITLLSGVDAANVAGQSIAATGSGLLVSTGRLRGPQGQQIHALDVLNGANPADTGNFLTRINLPAAPKDVALANGVAFVADGASGLQIVNYTGFDTKGVAPTVSITADAIDADPATPGIQVLEGRAVRIVPSIVDDVQVRNVELLVNGQVISNDVAFPWELFAQAPTIASGGSTMTLRVRATDTGGNVALSNVVTINVVPDTFAPQVTSVSVDEGARRFFVRTIDVVFDEPLDLARLATSGVHLVRAGADGLFGTADDVTTPVRLDTRNFGQSLSVVIDGLLPPGEFRFTLDPAVIADRAGNALAAPIVRNFSIRPASDVKASSGLPDIPTAPSANPGQQIGITVPFDPQTAKAQFAVVDAAGNRSTTVVNAVRWDSTRSVAYFNMPLNAVTGDAVVYSLVGAVRTDFADGTFPLQIIPIVSAVQVQSVATDGSSAVVVISGRGFVEGNNSEYRFGSGTGALVVLDAGNTTGADVQQVYDGTLGQYINGQVTLTVPLSDGAFGPISVKTSGGVSASYSVSLSSITATALSGTPADASKASANPGQAITLNGSGLSTNTDVLLHYTDYNGSPTTVKLNPSAASADGTSATLIVPLEANGAFSLQVFGSASQPLLQIVPVLKRYDESGGNLTLIGAGFVEGATRYDFAGQSLTDSAINAGADVTYAYVYDAALGQYIYNGSANLNAATLPRYGLGNVSISTAGGTSAAIALNALRPGSDTAAVGQLADVAVDPTSGALWVVDQANPGHLLRIDATSGAVVQTITLEASFGGTYTSYYAGLQVLPQAMTLAGTAVPAGSLLLFNGYANQVVAVNPSNGAVIARLSPLQSYAATAGVFDASTGHLFVLSGASELVELDATTGATVSSHALPINTQAWSGLAIDPSSGKLWLGSYYGLGQLVQIERNGVEIKRIELASQGIDNNEISGLAFAPDGSLRVASTHGVVYKVALTNADATTRPATLSQLIAQSTDGTPASAAVASANVGQLIELRGTNFSDATQVLFNTRDNTGKTTVVAVRPLIVNAAGTRLQVLVPNLATSGDIRVSNVGITNLGFGSPADAIHRQITTSFVAGGTSAVVRFSDGGLQSLADESWGIDNVLVKQGAATVFQDDFEGGAKANWNDRSTDKSETAAFSEFSGRFNNTSQALNLSGLTAGQTYTLSFDLYAIDSWEGASGQDLIDVAVDGVSVLDKTVSNVVTAAQTLNASTPIRLQVVPTLSGLSGSRPGTDAAFNLVGSGFMEGASSISIGGVVLTDTSTVGSPFDVSGARNDTFSVVAPLTLDGPIRITTDGGYAQLATPGFGVQVASAFTAINANAAAGVIADAAKPSANTGQTITLVGQGFTSSTLVQFQGLDDKGAVGTITRTGTAGAGGTTLTLQVPVLARSGAVSVLGSNVSIELQVVPTLRSVGGSISAGSTLVLEGSGLTSNDLAIAIDGRAVGNFSVRSVYDSNPSSANQQLLTLVVPNGVNTGVITVSTAGGSASLRKGATITALADLSPAADTGDTLADAQALTLAANQSLKVNASIGGTRAALDVDMYRVELNNGDQLTLNIANAASLYSHLRIFDATGKQVFISPSYFNNNGSNTPVRWSAPGTGSYYLGVSAYNNTTYDPAIAGSGSGAGYSGNYTLAIERLNVGSTRLSDITASAASGVPANAAVASANTGQTITLGGAGLLATDQIVFSTIDANGNLSELSVNPVSVAADGSSLTVLVPAAATTGHVRLARDGAGLLLQIVPTLNDVTMAVNGNFIGGTLTLTGSGFAEGASAVLLGGLRVDDASRSTGLNTSNTSISLTVPDGAATGPIRVATTGGTSAAFGVSLTGISASATSGSVNNTAQASANPGQVITLNGSGLDTSLDIVFQTVDASGTRDEVVVRPNTLNASSTQVQVTVPLNAVSGVVRVVGDRNAAAFPLQIIPLLSAVQVQSVATDGSSAVVVISGRGFVEGNNSEYRFGSGTGALVVLDAGNTTGADVQQVYDGTLGQYINGQVTLTVPLSDGAFGPISVKTSGGVSASYSVSLSSITATALSGTPADASKASANPGQAITLNGSGLSTNTDVLLHYTDYNGSPTTVKLNPSAASADGTSATLIVPLEANGAFSLQVFGSASQPLLQIVPVLKRYDESGGNLTLIGAGFVEGATRYDFAGQSLTDSAINAGADVTYAYVYDAALGQYIYNGSANLNAATLPRYGLGNVSISTAGGTSAAIALNALRPGSDTAAVGQLADVAVDPTSGALWVVDQANPGHLLRIDATSGAVVQTITLEASFGGTYTSYYAGLQVLPQAMTLAGTAVPAGSLLLFNGYANQVVAVNPSNGAVIARLSPLQSYAATAGVFDASTGHLFVLSGASELVELDATTGATVSSHALPINTQAWSGLAIDPSSGKLWLGSYYGLGQLVQIERNGVEIKRIELASQGIDNNEISGLAFAPDGSLRVASTHGVVYKVALTNADATTRPATLSQLIAQSTDGTPASAAVASANVGQLIELRGTNFSDATQVLFNTRDNTGKTTVVAVRPLIVNAAGTRLQVLVPNLATSGDIRVSNVGITNLGFGSPADAIHRQITTSFVAGGTSAVVRFSDGGLQSLADESWGIDNVLVKQGAATVFQDDFEGGAKANWNDRSTDKSETAAFSEFSGRFNNTSQALNLSGLTAGQTYTLSFDLYAIDSWEGASGQDLIDVAVDGVSVLDKTVSNVVTAAQTLNASTPIRLQVVPTLSGLSGSRPGTDAAFNLVGSGFMEGASSISIGGVVLTDTSTVGSPFDVSGARNDTFSVVAPLTLDGPIRITTDGGYAQLATPGFGVQVASAFTAINANAAAGVIADAAKPSANTGQTITLVGQGFTSSTLVQFQGLDDKGAVGTITRTGTAGAGGTTLTLQVPVLARSGAVSVLGSNVSIELQVVPTLRSVGGSISAGSTLVLEGSGLTSNDLAIAIDGRAVGNFSVRSVYDSNPSSANQQLLTLVVPNGVNTGVITVSTAGGSASLRKGATITALADLSPAADTGDTLADAQALTLAANQSLKVNASIGGTRAALDVDMYRVELNNGDQLTLNIANAASLYSHLRIFDATGKQVFISPSYFNNNGSNTPVRWSAPGTGSYYLGVSAYNNTTYDPAIAGSGSGAGYSGNYTLAIERLNVGSTRLSDITASAASGVPANAAVASANTGQTITLGGAGLLATDQIVFSTIDANGNLSELSVNPVSVAADGSSLTVLVPAAATTGHVRLARDGAGLLLQIVPTLNDVTMAVNGNFIGGTLTLTGSGFAEGASAVLLGGLRVDDASRSTGLNTSNTSISLTVPDGAATGPIRVATTGGTSAAFGVSLTGISASATSGSVNNTAQASANPGQVITLNGSGLDTSLDIVFQTVDASGTRDEVVVRPNTLNASSTQVQVTVPLNAVSGVVRVVGDRNAAAFPLQIIPLLSAVQVQSVATDGSSAVVVISGRGFVEGNNSEYRFGSGTGALVVLDAGNTTGADVQQVYDGTLGQYINGQVTLTVPLSDGAFGPISVKTSGGVSASYSVSLSSITATALSGTPADASKASANPGQAITLNGSGLSTNTDVLLHYTDYNGSPTTVKLNPSAASADGTSATLIVPLEANGAFSLQVFGSASQPLLQIVPVLKRYDESGGNLTLIGAGFVEGATRYDFAGQSLTDSAINAGADVTYAYVYDAALGQYIYNGSANLNAATLPRYGLGNVSISTAGGTSAAIALNALRPGSDTAAVGQLADVAVDPTSGALWVVDQANPGHLLRIDATSGAVVQTITLEASFGGTYTSYYAGLQVLPQAVTLAGTAVPAGSLLLFNGYANQVVAVNPSNGAVIARLSPLQSYAATAGVFDASTGHLFVLSGASELVELDATTGATVSSHALPINTQAWSGLAIDPSSGKLWLGSYYGLGQLVQIERNGVEIKRIELASQGIDNNEISGLAFAPDGSLRVASTHGVVYKVGL